MPDYQTLLTYELYGHTAENLGIALAIFLGSWLIFRLFRTRAIARLKKLASRTKTDFDDLIVRLLADIPQHFYILIALYLGLQSLELSAEIGSLLDGVLVVLVAYRAIIFLQLFFEYSVDKWWGGRKKNQAENTTAINGVKIIARILIWSAGLLLVLANLGFNVSALIASLGIGGIAVAFALQNILGDLFSSFAIYFDRPFAIGDYIVVGDDAGTVKRIGLKTTRLETLQGEELVISNNDLTGARVRNFRKMQKRLVIFSLGLTYDTTSTQLKKVPQLIEQVIKEVDSAEPERVHFREFGDFSLNFEVAYFVSSRDYKQYLDTQQQINLGIKQEFEKSKIEMAFPTQTVHMEK